MKHVSDKNQRETPKLEKQQGFSLCNRVPAAVSVQAPQSDYLRWV